MALELMFAKAGRKVGELDAYRPLTMGHAWSYGRDAPTPKFFATAFRIIRSTNRQRMYKNPTESATPTSLSISGCGFWKADVPCTV